MINVLLVESSLSHRSLIQIHLPDCCNIIFMENPADAAGLIKNQSFDMLITGPSVDAAYYPRLLEAASARPATAMVLFMSACCGAELSAEKFCWPYPEPDVVRLRFPSELGKLEFSTIGLVTSARPRFKRKGRRGCFRHVPFHRRVGGCPRG